MCSSWLFITFLVVSGSVNGNISRLQESRIFEKNIIQMFDCIQDVLKNGLPEIGLPSLEHLEIPYLNVNLTNLGIPGATGFIIINNTHISGITDFKLTDLHIKPMLIGGPGVAVKANLSLPSFIVSTDYEGAFSANNYPIFGEGKLTLIIQQLAVAVDAKMVIKNTLGINLAKFRAVPSVENIKLEITGFFNDDEQSALLSQLVDEEAVSWVNGKSENIADVLEEFVKNLVNIDVNFKGLQQEYADINAVISAILEKCPLE